MDQTEGLHIKHKHGRVSVAQRTPGPETSCAGHTWCGCENQAVLPASAERHVCVGLLPVPSPKLFALPPAVVSAHKGHAHTAPMTGQD